jgi:hypothetical protein
MRASHVDDGHRWISLSSDPDDFPAVKPANEVDIGDDGPVFLAASEKRNCLFSGCRNGCFNPPSESASSTIAWIAGSSSTTRIVTASSTSLTLHGRSAASSGEVSDAGKIGSSQCSKVYLRQNRRLLFQTRGSNRASTPPWFSDQDLFQARQRGLYVRDHRTRV